MIAPTTNGLSTSKWCLPLPKKILFAVVSTLGFFAVLEGGLALYGIRAANSAHDLLVGFRPGEPLFVHEGSDLVTNELKLSFFNKQRLPANKTKRAYRVFCLGGSTTYGHPFDDRVAYPRWLEGYLRECAPQRDWQIINCGGISYSSYRLALLMEELVEYQPDLFVIHVGHNEFLEDRSYGSIKRQSKMIGRALWLAGHSRTFHLMQSIAYAKSTARPLSVLASEVDTILEHTDGPQTYHRDLEWRRGALEHFRVSLDRMIALARESKSQVVLVQPASNVREFTPFKSEHGEQLTATQKQEWSTLKSDGEKELNAKRYSRAGELLLAAAAIDSQHADGLFLTAEALEGLGRQEDAANYYHLAKDEDVCPLRALSEMNELVSQVANNERVPVVNLPEVLRKRCHQLTGQDALGLESFHDHVHLTLETHQILGRELARTILDIAHLARGKDLESRTSAVSRQVMGRLTHADIALALNNLAMTLSWAGKNEEGLRLSEKAAELQPNNAEILSQYGRLLEKAGKNTEALSTYQRVLASNPDDSLTLARLAGYYGRLGDIDLAIRNWQNAIEKTPERAPLGFRVGLHLQLGDCLRMQEKIIEARAQYTIALKLDPTCDSARTKLSELLSDPRE